MKLADSHRLLNLTREREGGGKWGSKKYERQRCLRDSVSHILCVSINPRYLRDGCEVVIPKKHIVFSPHRGWQRGCLIDRQIDKCVYHGSKVWQEKREKIKEKKYVNQY